MIFSLLLKVAVASVLVMLAYILCRALKSKKQHKRADSLSEKTKLLFLIYLSIVIALLLIPNISLFAGPDNKITFSAGIIPQRSSNFIPFHTLSIQFNNIINKNYDSYPILNIAGNLLLYIPFPILLKLNWKNLSLSKCFIISFATVITSELIQYIEGRTFDVDDIILNGIGILLGIMIYILIKSLAAEKQRQ